MRVGDNFCPGVLHAVPAKDGLLLRIRIPGGLLDAAQLHAVAGLASILPNQQMEITSRSNLQLRGIQTQQLARIIEGIVSAGLLPSRAHDRVRNITGSPLAGTDPQEIIDTVPILEELDCRLRADAACVELHPKFSLALCGGGRWFSREIDDLTLQAMVTGNGIVFHLVAGGWPTGLGVSAAHAATAMVEAAKICLRVAQHWNLPPRARTLLKNPEAAANLRSELPKIFSLCPLPADVYIAEEPPVGILPGKTAGYASLVPSIPLGRLRADQAQDIASLAQEHGARLRLAPWRGLVLGMLPEETIRRVAARLQEIGLSSDGRDGFRGLAACAGIHGCDASLMDVRADAVEIARRLAGAPSIPGWTVNLAGCEKRCAMRHGATAELVATSAGYKLTVHGIQKAVQLSSDDAIQAVVRCHAKHTAEVLR